MTIAGYKPRPATPEEQAAWAEEIIPKTGKEILAAMELRRDIVHEQIMERLRDECRHLFPWFERNDGSTACCGCARSAGEIGARRAELVADKQRYSAQEFKIWQETWAAQHGS